MELISDTRNPTHRKIVSRFYTAGIKTNPVRDVLRDSLDQKGGMRYNFSRMILISIIIRINYQSWKETISYGKNRLHRHR
jgi:hypothetical protein